MNDITPKEAIANLNHLYGMVSPDIQRSLDVAIKALERQQDNQIAWKKGYECGYHQAKEDIAKRIKEQYNEHHELIPYWLSIGDVKGGAE